MRKSTFRIVILLPLLCINSLISQHQEVPEKPGIWRGGNSSTLDTQSILYAFKNGKFNGHLRHYFMSTDNAALLKDYYANASGGGIRYETRAYYGFKFAVSGFFVFNTGSSDLEQKDSITGASNRYEIGLFDIEDPKNKKDIDRLEEFYLKYEYKNFNIIYGRQLINTPFVNLQDGRMRPTGVEGVWTHGVLHKKLKWEGGWLYAISPRSTTKWYNVEQTIGVYSSGVSSLGQKSNYRGNITSAGLFLAGLQYNPKSNMQITAWNLLAENIFNASLFQIEVQKNVNNNTKVIAAAQGIHEFTVADGGNTNPSLAYADKGAKSYTFGFKLAVAATPWETSVNYNRITKHGRYLMPREFGRDPFFTFIPRERNEGLGDVHAFMARALYKIPKYRIQSAIAVGHFTLPDVQNYKLNKYGMPSYNQVNIDVRYAFPARLNGLEMQFLWVLKTNAGNTYGKDIYRINKVDMVLYNLVLNFHF